MNWFKIERINWISESIRIFGFINRKHLVLKFRISIPQASQDLKEVNELFPNMMVYNSTTKRYERVDS